MIAKLSGLVSEVGDGWAIIDVSGVGYMVFCSSRTLNNLPDKNNEVSLLIETHVREDHIHLYGFETAMDKEWFKMLQSVQGVGAKVALAILSVLDSVNLFNAIAIQDKIPFTNVSGIGPKLAQRIVSELKDKAKLNITENLNNEGSLNEGNLDDSIFMDAVSALVNLGYPRTDVLKVISKINNDKEKKQIPLESYIKHGLKELSNYGERGG